MTLSSAKIFQLPAASPIRTNEYSRKKRVFFLRMMPLYSIQLDTKTRFYSRGTHNNIEFNINMPSLTKTANFKVYVQKFQCKKFANFILFLLLLPLSRVHRRRCRRRRRSYRKKDFLFEATREFTNLKFVVAFLSPKSFFFI